MASQKSIKLYIYESETSSLPFCYPNGEQIEISAFKYNAKRMGGTPTITCTLRSQYCLDSDWKNSIYCVFRDEKFYLRQTPSGTKSNTEYGYSYNLEFVSERDLLNNVYMFDAVNTEEEFDKPASNSTKISFFGDINRFADKINASLRYSGLQKKDSEGNILGYKVIVDKGITSEEKYVLIEDTFFSNAIQEIYNTFEIPYYFKGKEIHIGDKDALIPTVFKYGVDESLLSIKRENSNNKIVNRATGFGSTDNIPYYYPNKSPKGDISADASEGLNVKIVNYDRFANQVDIDEVLTYTVGSVSVLLTQASDDGNHYDTVSASPVDCVSGQTTKKWFRSHIRIKKTARYRVKGDLWFNGSEQEDFIKYIDFISLQDENFVEIPRVFNKEDGYFDLGVREAGDYWIIFGFQLTYRGMPRYMVSFNPVVEFDSGWKNAKGKSITLSDAGLEIVGDTVPKDGDTIKQILIKKLNNATNLMPSIYRKTDGRERFYNAINGKYVDESGNPIAFNNPYIEGRPSEDIINVEDIKPTIKECVNSGNQRIDMFSEIAYDDGDNDEVYTDSEGNTAYKHPHFFVKLRKLPFNLFDCAIEGSEMTFSITKGDCGACSFKVKVDDEFPYKNTVQVYEEDTTDDKGVLHKRGTLVKDENGMVLCGLDGFQPKVKPQDIQQDTINNEVWIALEKEEETYGILMPKAPKYNDSGNIEEAGYRIKPCSSDTTDDGDTFVILNIHLPEEYITAAEKKLEDVIIANMKDNNDEKFNFSITFSSIFFEEHPEILSLLDENSQIKIEYAGEQITQFVSSFSYNMNSGSALPSISVELSDSLSVSQNSIKTAINQVQLNVKKALEQESIAQQEAFISKTENDVVNGNIDFRKGVKFGDGCKVDIDEYNNTRLIIDYLTVNKKAVFTALDVQDMHHIGGRVLITPASMICNKVEEFTDFYRCYFQNYDDGGNQIFNNFVIDDQAICKTLNTWGTTYYWRLVVGVGNNYIDLSKTDCDSNSDAPRAGDKIVQLGNRSTNDNSRKSAIEISAYGDNTPSLVMYTDIDSYSLKSKEIHGTIYRNNNGEYEAYFYNYGSMLLGDPNKEKDYIEFDASKGIFEVKANVKFKASQSLDDIDAFKNLSTNVGSNTTAITQINTTLGTVNENISSLDYLKEAILNGNTQVMGGLILSSLIQLGFKEGEDFKIMSGINGVYDSNKFSGGVASWFGGAMQDKEHLAEGENKENSAKSLFRFDGTGYLASGNITWDEKGYGQIGGEGDNYALKWNDKEVRIGPNIKLGAGDETIAMLANLLNMFELDTTSVAGKTLIHAKYDGLYSDGDIAAGGAWAGTPSEGGKNYLNELLDVQLATSSLNVGDMLMWNGAKYVNIPQSSITPDLSAYATQQWVLDKKYLTSAPVTSVVGQTGNITAAQVATALTDAGYKLTDTTYELATTTSNGLMSSSDKVKLNNIEEGANKYIHPTTAGYKHIPSGGSSGQILRWSADGTAVWGEDKDTTYPPATQSANGLMSATDKTKLDGIAANANNYTLPTASSSTKGGIKVGATLSISGEVLDLKSGFPKGTYTKVQIDDYGRVSSGSTLSASDIPSLPWSKITTGKPTTISGYGITDAYTKTETDNKVAELQSLLDSMFERIYDSNNKLIRIHSNVTISSSGDLVAGSDSEGGGTSGGAYTQLEWNAIKALTQSESGLLASAYSVKEAYNELNTAIEALAGKATNVKFTQTLTSGKQIGSISIDGKSTSLFAPASYAWSEVTGKPSFATVATSGSYTDLTNKPTIASLMGSTAIGGTSSYIYWNGSAWATKALGSNAFTSISKVSQLTNDSGYITGITKAMVEGVLTGNITSHTHSQYLTSLPSRLFQYITIELDDGNGFGRLADNSPFKTFVSSSNKDCMLVTTAYSDAWRGELALDYRSNNIAYRNRNNGTWNSWAMMLTTDNFGNYALPLSGGTMSNTNVVTNLNADLLDGLHAASFYQHKPIRSDQNSIYDLRFNYGSYDKGDYHGTYKDEYPTGYGSYLALSYNDKNTGALMFFDAPTSNVLGHIYVRTRGAGDRNTTYSEWGTLAYLTDNVASASKWKNARTITLTGSVTGSVSIDGSANVSLATTTNHTHNYAGSSSAGGSANSALTLLYNDILDTNYGNYAVFQQFAGLSDLPHAGWFNSIKMLHNNSAGYFTEIATSFTGEDGMWRRALRGGTQVGWYKMLDSGNYNSYALPLTGGTLTGSVTMSGMNANLIRNITYTNTTGWARDLITLQVDGVHKFGIGAHGGYTVGASSNGIYYGYIGCNSYNGLNLRISATSLSWGDNPLLHSSNFNSYAPTLTGTGASGTWGINISGNAATATDADTLDGYHAYDFVKSYLYNADDLTRFTNRAFFQTSWISGQGDFGTLVIPTWAGNTNSDYYTTELRFRANYFNPIIRCTHNDDTTDWKTIALVSDNVASASKWANARTITLTGSVTGSVSIDGSQNVSLATTTNHTHTFASLTDKPTTISGYGITDAYTASTIDSKLSGYLPLSGGTIEGNVTMKSASFAFYYSDSTFRGYLGATGDDRTHNLYWYDTSQWNILIHSGNYNSYCPTLTGVGASGTWGISITGNAATADTLAKTFAENINYAAYTTGLKLIRYDDNWEANGFPKKWTSGLSVMAGYCGWQLVTYGGSEDTPYFRRVSDSGIWSNWRALAFTDSNVASATKLATSRTIWGQSFDGTGNVSGDIKLAEAADAKIGCTYSKSDANLYNYILFGNMTSGIQFVSGSWTSSQNELVFDFKTGLKKSSALSILNSGNVGIGTTSPAYKLHVVGTIASAALMSQEIELSSSTPFIDFHYNSSTADYTSRIIEGLSGQLTVIGKLRVGLGYTTSTNYAFHVVGTAYASENIIATGDLTAGSDIRYKDKIQDLRLSVHDIALAPAFTYKWNNREDALVHIGSSAQYWLNTDAKDAVYYDKQNDFYHLNYASLALCNTIILARGMETQEEKIARLEDRIKELEDKLRQYDCSR